MMNLFLSLCIIMSALSGAAPLPALPETATTTVVRDICVEFGDESLTLNPEFVISTAVGSEAAAARFEVRSGDDVLLPMAGEITADGLRFSLMDSGRVYSLDEATMYEMMMLGEEDAAMMEKMGGLYRSLADLYQRIFAGETMDPEEAAKLNAVLAEALGAEVEAAEMDIEGTVVPGESWIVETDAAGLIGAVEVMLAASEDGVIKELYDILLELYAFIGEMEGVQISSLADFAGELPEIPVTMDYCYAAGDGMAYEWMVMEMQDDASGVSYYCDAEETYIGNAADTNLTMSIVDPTSGGTVDMNIGGRMVFDGMVPSEADLTFNLDFSTEVPSAADEMVVYPVFTTEGSLVYGDEDGVRNGQIDVRMVASEPQVDVETTEEGAVVMSGSASEETEITLLMNWDEEPLETGVLGSVYMGMDALVPDEEPISASIGFEYEKQQGSAALITGDQEIALTADLAGEGNTMLPIDFMGVIADGTTLAAEESIMEAAAMLGENMEAAMIYGADEYNYDGEYDYSEYDMSDVQTVTSLEEAEAIYEGTIPAYTAPEGYVLDRIDVSSWYYDSYYTNGERSINIYGYENSAEVEETQKYLLQADGTLALVEEPVVDIYSYDGVINSANVTMGNQVVYFYFDYDTDLAGAQAAVAGLAQ